MEEAAPVNCGCTRNRNRVRTLSLVHGTLLYVRRVPKQMWISGPDLLLSDHIHMSAIIIITNFYILHNVGTARNIR